VYLDHPIPYFCPASLLEYRSQDQPDFMDFEEQHRIRLEDLESKPGDPSRRLDSEALERSWEKICPPFLPLPLWTRGDSEITGRTIAATTRMNGHDTPSLVSTSPGNSASSEAPITPSSEEGHKIQSKTLNRRRLRIRRTRFPTGENYKVVKIIKHSPPPARRTRSHNVTAFYELSQDGLPICSRRG
jgi:hypothetical protein